MRALAVIAAAAIAGCATVPPPPAPGGGAGAGTEDTLAVRGIPPGQLPRPGACRIWYPGRPPGRQPPARACDRVMTGDVPAEAWLLHRPRPHPQTVELFERDPYAAGAQMIVSVFDVKSGDLLSRERRRER